eukprot:GDKI01014683.1.p1 GENE.GDKI01014683.1~~GDKI01014683.1.p1  ORF type:complete len:299 (+),score=44.54 GDKI01014683.1:162-1058(+)
MAAAEQSVSLPNCIPDVEQGITHTTANALQQFPANDAVHSTTVAPNGGRNASDSTPAVHVVATIHGGIAASSAPGGHPPAHTTHAPHPVRTPVAVTGHKPPPPPAATAGKGVKKDPPCFSWACFCSKHTLLELLCGCVFVGVTFLLTKVPCQDVGSEYLEGYRKMYRRDTFPWNTYCIWTANHVMGYVFIRGVTYGNPHKNPFKSRHGSFKHIIRLFIISLCLFFIGPIWTLNSECESPSDPDSYAYMSALMDGFGFSLPFFIGCHFNYLDKPPLNKITLTAEAIKQWTAPVWICVCV